MRRWWGSMLVVAAVVSGCGDPGSVDRAASSGDDQDEVTETVAGIPDDSVGITFDHVVPADLGGVTIDDPIPPQADAATDETVAVTAVHYAYQHWILVDLDPDLRARLIENGEANRDRIATGFEAARGIVEYARIEVDTVTFPEPDRAQVTFRMRWNEGASPYFPSPLVGDAVFRDGTWRISGRILCLLALGSGQDCAGEGPNPESPVSFTVAAVPEGYVWDGSTEPAGVVGTDGMSGSWLGEGQLVVSAEALVGASSIDPADVDQLLSAIGRFGEAPSTRVDVGAFPGRVVHNTEFVQLVVLRDDDVVVHVQLVGTGVTVDDALAVARSLAPSDIVPVLPPESAEPADGAFG